MTHHSAFDARPNRRQFLAGAAAMAAASQFPTLAFAQPAAVPATLAVGTANYSWALPFVAEYGGYWKQEGVALRTLDFSSGRDAMQALLAGSANFSTTADSPFVFAVLRGLKPRVLASFSRYSYDMKIVIVNGKGVDPATPASLKGKKIGIPFGTSAQYAVARYLEYAGLKPEDVTQINLGSSDLINALLHGDIDAFCWTNSAAIAAHRQSEGRTATLKQEGYEAYFRSHQLLLVNEATLANKPLLSHAVKALLDAEQRIKTDPNWASLIAERLKTPAAQITSDTSTFDFGVRFDQDFLNDLVLHAQWAIDTGVAPKPKEDLTTLFRNAIHTATLQELAPGRVTI